LLATESTKVFSSSFSLNLHFEALLFLALSSHHSSSRRKKVTAIAFSTTFPKAVKVAFSVKLVVVARSNKTQKIVHRQNPTIPAVTITFIICGSVQHSTALVMSVKLLPTSIQLRIKAATSR
jgi:hypothetical protein